MPTIKEILQALLQELKGILREYVHESEAAIKKRLKKLLISGVIMAVLVALVTSFIGSAALFLLVGQLRYLETFLPAWEAWDIVGVTAIAIGVVILLGLYVFIRRQLKSEP